MANIIREYDKQEYFKQYVWALENVDLYKAFKDFLSKELALKNNEDAAKAAYLATAIEYGLYKIEKYSSNAHEVMGMKISATVSKEVTKIRRGNPEAYYYWSKISDILQGVTQMP